MPEVTINLAAGRTPEQKRGLIKDLTQAVVTNLGVEPGSVIVSLLEVPKDHKAKGGVLFSER